MKIGKREIGPGRRPYMIAEIGVNHENRLDLALQMVNEIAEAGGDAAKFQTYKAENLASRNSPAYWDTEEESARTQYGLFKEYDSFGQKEYERLARECDDVGIDFLSTAFDTEAVKYLAPLMPAFKVASADITNYPLLAAISDHSKPVFLSTGASTLDEVAEAVMFLRERGVQDIAVLHCVLSYPTDPSDANLGVVRTLAEEFPACVAGYSDHVPPDEQMTVLTTAYVLGALVIEKHFTFDKTLSGNDHYHAMDGRDLRSAIGRIEHAHRLMGSSEKRVLEVEKQAREYARRSLVTTRCLSEGEVLERQDLAVKRPGTGLEPRFLESVVGRSVTRDIEADEVLRAEDIADMENGMKR